MHAIFDFNTRKDGVVALKDHCIPGVRSLTNDAEWAAGQAWRLSGGPRRIVYRDSDGSWDGLATDEQGKFLGFVALDAGTEDEAAQAALAVSDETWRALGNVNHG